MPPRRSSFNQGDMWRMTRDAEQRVREMRERARSVAQNSDLPIPTMPQRENRNWSTDTGRRRDPPPESPAVPPPANRQPSPEQSPASQKPPPEPALVEPLPPEPAPPKGDTTIVQDIVRAIGIEEDTLLILGLILILINQKADTTLILALAYLLI